MNRNQFTFKSEYSAKEIKHRLEDIIMDKASFLSFLKEKKFEGAIRDNSFSLKSYDSPPVIIRGEFEDDLVHISINWESNKSSIKGLIYGLGYPLIILILFCRIYESPTSIWVYLSGFIALFLPIIIYRVYILTNYVEPDPESFLEKIKNELKLS